MLQHQPATANEVVAGTTTSETNDFGTTHSSFSVSI